MQSKAEEAEDMKEGQGFRHGSEDPAEEDSLDRTQSNGLDNTQSIGRARRTPRGPPAYSGRSGSRVSSVPLLQHLEMSSLALLNMRNSHAGLASSHACVCVRRMQLF